jgi:hypothetical protein
MEYEKIREKIREIIIMAEAFGRHSPKAVWDNAHIEAEDDYIDLVLSIKGIRIECSNQDLPKVPYFPNGIDEVYKRAQGDMLTPDKEGNVWVKCLKKEEKG